MKISLLVLMAALCSASVACGGAGDASEDDAVAPELTDDLGGQTTPQSLPSGWRLTYVFSPSNRKSYFAYSQPPESAESCTALMKRLGRKGQYHLVPTSPPAAVCFGP